MSSGRPFQQQGFTLIEALIALALLALLGLASALALDSALRSQDQLGTHQRTLERLQRSQLLLQRDLEQALIRQGRDQLGQLLTQAFTAYPQADSSQQGLLLRFFKSGRRMLGQQGYSRLEQVRYRLEGGQLIRETTPILDPSGQTQWHGGVLLQDISELQLSFFHGNSWHQQWPPLNQNNSSSNFNELLPRAIAIETTSEQHPPLRQLILLPGGQS